MGLLTAYAIRDDLEEHMLDLKDRPLERAGFKHFPGSAWPRQLPVFAKADLDA